MATSKSPQLALMLLPLVLLSAGCASNWPPSVPPSVQPAQRPRLPQEGRQPPTPSICSPTCSAGLERELENWRASLMNAAPPARSASEAQTPPTEKGKR